ncbi:MAG TPA: signal peptide peptidase SppA [Gemmatimonadota bacterium]|nr:signal peptide peptidase SppA [Gemmatimonadota bacterium]
MKRLAILLAVILSVGVLMFLAGVFLLLPRLSLEPRAEFDTPGILRIDLDGLVVERAPPEFLGTELLGAQVELFDLVLALDRAAEDDRIAGVYLEVGRPGYGWAKAEEIRSRLARFRESGKFVYAYTSFTNELGYFVALAADSLWLMPDAGLELNGFRVETPFVSRMLEKVGLEPQVEAIGVYKSAADMFRRENMSDPEREVTESILRERYDRFVQAVTEERGVDRERFTEAFDRGLYLAREIDALGLVDGQAYASEVMRRAVAAARDVALDEVDNRELDDRFVELDAYAAALPDPSASPAGTIGLVYAIGAITGGESGFDPVFGRTIGAETMVRMLRDVGGDDELDAVVLRIESPGGDALASEEIWAAVGELGEALPIVVSMGDVAGSGGYYIAAAADEIVAAPSTITGSIGVFGVLFNAAGTWEKLGITWDSARTNPAADFPTNTRALTETERETFRRLIEDVYRSFLERVAEGREMPVAAVDRVAQGRIWTGTQAVEQGLVDRVGGLEAAMVVAREAAGIDPDAHVRLHVYPRQQTVIERLREVLLLRELARSRAPQGGELAAIARMLLPDAAATLTGAAAALREGPRRPLAVMPFVPVIH